MKTQTNTTDTSMKTTTHFAAVVLALAASGAQAADAVIAPSPLGLELDGQALGAAMPPSFANH